MITEPMERLARYLLAASIASQLRISLAYAYRAYATGRTLDPYWLKLAGQVTDEICRRGALWDEGPPNVQ